MQRANANAPKILEAMQLLGSSDPTHVAFAMCGLAPDLQKAAETAAAALRPVASRLKSRKIACQLRMETAQLMAASTQKDSSPVDLTSPPSDLFDVLIEQTIDVESRCHRVAPETLRWEVGCKFLRLSRAWANAVRGWRCHERYIFLRQVDDVALRVVARGTPALEQLNVKSASYDRCLLRDGTLLLLAAGCPRLTELELPDCVLTKADAISELVQALPRLRRLDINGIRCVERAVEMTVSERATTTLQFCLALLQEAPRLERLQVVRCDVCSQPHENEEAWETLAEHEQAREALALIAAADRLEVGSCGCQWCEARVL